MSGRKNMFADAAVKREQEQAGIQAAVMETDEEAQQRTSMAIAMSVREKKLLKQYAAARGKTAASIVQGWINQFCTNS